MSKREKLIKVITWVVRFMCGTLFIYSGFVKAVDPWGFIFKIEEYLGAFGFTVPFALIRLGAFGLCAVEFIVGCFLLLGCFRKSCPVFAALIMAFMLPLSLWIAIENPVEHCGCFGDALILSNWATFWKNIGITAGVIWLMRFNTKGICLIIPAFQWLAVVASGIFIVTIELIGYFYQPLIDFRDYPIGSSLFASENEDDEHGIDVFDINTLEDVNHLALDPEGKEMVVMMPKVSMVSPATTWKLNSLYEWSQGNDVKMIGIVSGSPDEIEEWEDLSMAAYPVFLADDTAIKEVVRGNPGVVFLNKGNIEWKASLNSIDVDDFLSPEISGDASSFGRNNALYLRNCVLIYVIFITFLIFISFTPRMARILTKGGLASKKGVRHH